MNNFQIEEIVFQDETGVTYLAEDTAKGYSVSLRRFFPFSEKRSGLNQRDGHLYEVLLDKLAWIEHPSLRPVMLGGLDPIDGIPYIVTPWYEGLPLNYSLGGKTLTPEVVLKLLLSAFEISTLISTVLQEEGVWVEADSGHMIIEKPGDYSSISFCLSPHKLLRIHPELKRPASLLSLVESLAPPNLAKIKTKTAAGLYAWMKWQAKNPGANLKTSYLNLTEQTGAATPATENFNYPASINNAAPFKNNSRLTIALIAIVGIACIAMIAFSFTGKEEEQAEIILEKPPVEEKKPPREKLRVASKASQVNQLEEQLKRERAASAKKTGIKAAIPETKPAEEQPLLEEKPKSKVTEKPPKTAAPKVEPPKQVPPKKAQPAAPTAELLPVTSTMVQNINASQYLTFKPEKTVTSDGKKIGSSTRKKTTGGFVYSSIIGPEDREIIEQIPNEVQIEIEGILQRIYFSESGGSLLLDFISPFDEKNIRGLIWKKQAINGLSPENLKSFIGKKIKIKARVYRENLSSRGYARLWNPLQIETL